MPNIASCRQFLKVYLFLTSLERDIAFPLLLFLFLSKIVSRRYLEDPGEHVKSFVKSDFLPYPMPLPFLVNDDLDS